MIQLVSGGGSIGSSGYVRRPIYRRLQVRIPALETIWLMLHSYLLFFKMGHHWPLFRKQTLQLLQQINVKNFHPVYDSNS